jgi:hypothetical protein
VVPDKTYHLAAYLTDIRWHLTLVWVNHSVC